MLMCWAKFARHKGKGIASQFEGPCCRCSIDPEREAVYLPVSPLSCSTIYHNAKIVIKWFENVAVSRYLGATVTNDPASVTKWRTLISRRACYYSVQNICPPVYGLSSKTLNYKEPSFYCVCFFFQTHREHSEILPETGKNLPFCILSISLFTFFLLVHLRNKIGLINKWNNYIP